jgi:hypothetical protein
MEQCETEGCCGVVFKHHLCLVCANKLFDTATSSDGRLIEALECAKYAIENPDSNQAFAIMAIDHALNTATSSDELVKEIDDYFNLSFLGDHVSRMQQAAELLQKCKAALQGSDSK